MPLLPQPRRPSLTNADQTVTKVDTVNPSGASRTTLNKSEQIRTTPNTVKRPDQIGTPPESPPNTTKNQP